MKINDLRKLVPRPPAPLAEAGRREASKHHCHKGTHRTQRKKLLSSCSSCPAKAALIGQAAADVPFCGRFISHFPRPLPFHPIPLQTFKEQAPERLTYSTLPYLAGNARTNIQLFSAPTELAIFSRRGRPPPPRLWPPPTVQTPLAHHPLDKSSRRRKADLHREWACVRLLTSAATIFQTRS